jgi:hypothetical protein
MITSIPIGLILWTCHKKVLVIPIITTIYEGGFFKLNDIKNHFLSCLKMDTFDALIHVSLWGIEVDNMD